MPEFTTYEEVAAAFKSGALENGTDAKGRRTGYYIMLDKGGCENSLSFYDPNLSDRENERRQDECNKIFEPPYGVEPLFKALGIPCEWC